MKALAICAILSGAVLPPPEDITPVVPAPDERESMMRGAESDAGHVRALANVVNQFRRHLQAKEHDAAWALLSSDCQRRSVGNGSKAAYLARAVPAWFLRLPCLFRCCGAGQFGVKYRIVAIYIEDLDTGLSLSWKLRLVAENGEWRLDLGRGDANQFIEAITSNAPSRNVALPTR